MPAPLLKPSLSGVAPQSQIGLASNVRAVDSIRHISAEAWNACFAGELEDYSYLLSVEDSRISGFSWRYITAEEDGVVVAAMPAFFTDYHLDTTLDHGVLRDLIHKLRRYFPRFLTMKLACVGSPCTETGLIGFHRDVPESRKSELFSQLLAGFERDAMSHGYRLLGIKDIAESSVQFFGNLFKERKYSPMPGMPTAWLSTDFNSIDEYLMRLSAETRKDMRRKMKLFAQVRVEERTNVDDILPQLMALYHDTRARSVWQFEELTAEYFTGVLSNMPGRSFCTLYYAGEQLLGANLLINDRYTLIDKFFCMNGVEGRKYNLYFLSWFTNLNYCLKHGFDYYQSGQALYHDKLRLGSHLIRNTMYFRHGNFLIQSLLQLVAPFLGADETLKEPK